MIEKWIKEGKKNNYYGLLIASDDFSYEIYPVYIKTEEEYKMRYEEHNNRDNMSSVKEVIILENESE